MPFADFADICTRLAFAKGAVEIEVAETVAAAGHVALLAVETDAAAADIAGLMLGPEGEVEIEIAETVGAGVAAETAGVGHIVAARLAPDAAAKVAAFVASEVVTVEVVAACLLPVGKFALQVPTAFEAAVAVVWSFEIAVGPERVSLVSLPGLQSLSPCLVPAGCSLGVSVGSRRLKLKLLLCLISWHL